MEYKGNLDYLQEVIERNEIKMKSQGRIGFDDQIQMWIAVSEWRGKLQSQCRLDCQGLMENPSEIGPKCK